MRKLLTERRPSFDLRHEMNEVIALRAEVARLEQAGPGRQLRAAVRFHAVGATLEGKGIPSAGMITRLQRRIDNI
jgi:hypothetical protein